MGRNPTMLHTKSKSESPSETSINTKQPNQRLVNLCSLDGPSTEEGLGPDLLFYWSPTMPLCWSLYVCWLAPNTKASRHPILLAWFKEEKKALLLPWVIPGQASQERPVGGSCSKGAPCSQPEVPSHPHKCTSTHLPKPEFATVQPPLQEVHWDLCDSSRQQ